MLMGSITTIVCELVSYLIQIIIFKLSIEIIPLLEIIVVETVFNLMLIIILYPLIVKSGNKIEKIFRDKNILTKYYQ